MGVEKSTTGDRLREERERLGYNQTTFAALAGASKHSQIDWEKNTASPNTRYLGAIAKAGADVLYIITGERRTTDPLSFRPDLLQLVVEGIEELLHAKRLRVSPAKKGGLIVVLYEHYSKVGHTAEKATIERFLRLVK
jgi:transcriptional regulator with XRE-family HTH domain